MSNKYRGKYRIKSTRLPSWDYGWNGAYFITICTGNREYHFGEIVPSSLVVKTQDFASLRQSAIMKLSEIGKIASDCWYEIPEHFPFVKLGAFVVMPNHVHGIVIIDKPDGDPIPPVETQDFASLQGPTSSQKHMNKFGPQSKNLASIIRGYKTGVTKNARKLNPGFKWQPRYHDHIIRNEKSFHRISQYIINNPQKWADDVYHHQ